MVKIKLPIKACSEGDILAVDIFGNRGALIAAENTIINENIKNSLKNLGIDELWIFKPSLKTVNEDDSIEFNIFQQEYESNIKTLVQISRNLAIGKNINIDILDILSDSVLKDVRRSNISIFFLNKMKVFDDTLFNHSLNVAFYAALICKWMNVNENKTKNIIKTGLLHDIGKIEIPLELLKKKEKLRPSEFDLIKCHTLFGFNQLKDIAEIDSDIKSGVLFHHERENGSGYPFGYSGKQLNLNAKIIAVADTYDALTSDRVYKKKQTPFRAIEILLTECVASYDISIINSFTSNLLYYFIGSKVLLSNGEKGIIVHIPLHNITEPIVYINSLYIDLSAEADLSVIGII